ncbi:MAG: CPBP family intramembrane metalloprotease [Myxococcota bacterium]|nr:CPBP family intramembrane metalloprotease [Myxococcota bacterium]
MPRARGQLSIAQTVLLLLLGLALLYGGVMFGAAIRMAAQGIPFERGLEQVTSEPFGPGMAQLFALGTVLLVGTRMAYGDRSLRAALQVRPVRMHVALLAIVAGLALHLPLVELMAVISDLAPELALDEDALRRLEDMTRIDGWVRAITVPLTVVAIAATTEELVFRGLLLPALRPRLGVAGAWVLTSLLFGVFHVTPFAAIYATIAGLVLGGIAIRTRSVLPCIAFHGAFNAVPLLLPQEVLPIEGLNVGETDAHVPLPFVLAGLVIGVIALVLLHRTTVPPAAGSHGNGSANDDDSANGNGSAH